MKKIILLALSVTINVLAYSQIKPIVFSTTTAVITDANGTIIGSNTPRVCPNGTIPLEAYTKTFSKLLGTTMTPVAKISGYQIQWYYKRHYSAPLSFTVKLINTSLSNLFIKNTATIITKEPTIDTTTWLPISGATSPTFNFAYNSFFTSNYDKTYIKFTVTYSTTTLTSDSITILRTTQPKINSFSVLPYYCPGKLIDVLPDVSVYNKYADTIMFGWQRATYANGAITGLYAPYIDSLHLAIPPADFGAYDYQLTASNMCGISYSASLHSKVVAPSQAVNELVAINPSITTLNTCIGSQGTIGTLISPINSGLNHTYVYSWEYYNGSTWNTIDSTQQSIYTNYNSGTIAITPPNTTITNYKYRCKVTGLCANPITGNVSLNVKSPINIAQVSASIPTICRDSTAHLSVTATGSTPYYYRWITGNYVSDWSTTTNTFSYPVGEVNQQFRIEIKNDFCPDVPFKTTTVNVYDLPTVDLAATFSSCNGTNGDISSTITGGQLPYSYVWNNASTNSYLKDVVPSTYSVTVKDACNQKGTESIVVSQLPALAVSVSTTNVSCYGLQNGKIAVSISGGKKNYQYKWADASAKGGNGIVDSVTNTVTIEQLKPGIYNVTITDDCSASIVKAITINQPEVLTSTIGTSKDVTCYGGADAWASVDVKGGSAPYVYNWNNLQNSQTAVGLFAGDYTVNVIDSKGCLSQAGITINQPKKLGASIIANDNSCYGESKGNAVLKVVGGTKPYSYLWDNGSTSDSIFDLPAKTYTCIVNDACNTNLTKTVNISQPSQILLQYSIANPTCAGMTNGSAEVTIGGGVEPYSYVWSDTAHSTSNSIKNIGAGTYSVKVSDHCGLKDSISMTVYEPDTLSVDLTKLNASCNGIGNGQATAFVKGGTSPYYYNWSTGQHGSVANGLYAGYYSVNILDAQNCMTSNAVTITEPAKITFEQTIINNTCNGDSIGQISVKANGSMGGYKFNWNNGSSNDTISKLKAGNYSITVTDSICNETISKAFTITEPTAISVITKITDVKCFGENNGKAIVVANGGTAPYNYLLDKKSTSDTLENLIAGTYELQTFDACNDSVKTQIIISQAQSLQVATHIENVKCYGQGNGTISALATGGKAPYMYNWSNGFSGTKIIGLFPGTYTLNAFDSKGCLTSRIITVTQPEPLIINIQNTDASCNNKDGKISTTITGGTKPYSYSWSNAIKTADNDKLANGSYSLTIVDSLQCTETASTEIKTYVAPTQICLVTVDSITGKNKVVWEKIIDSTIQGYNIYKWGAFGYQKIGIIPHSENSVFNDALSNPLIVASKYAISVIDKCKNESALSPSHQTIFLGASQGMEQGTAVLDWTEYIDESGGFVPTEYLIYRGKTKANMEFLASVSVGTEYIDTNPQGSQQYRVIVKKKELCNVQGIQKSDSGPFSQSLSNMAESELTGSSIIDVIDAEIKTYPNPTDGNFTVSITSEKTKFYTLILSNVMGEILYETKTGLTSQITIPISVPNLSSGIYQLKVMTDEGVRIQNIAISK